MIPSFYRYMESTRHLLLYRLDALYPVPMHLRLPFVDTIVLVHCAPEAVGRFLQPTVFPSLRRIHYLSAAPTDPLIHRSFGTRVGWVFPYLSGGASYPFYDRMMEGGWGRRTHGLAEQYLVRHKPYRKETWFDLYLPQRGIVDGEWYYAQQMAYLRKKHCDAFHVFYPLGREYASDRCRIPPLMETHALVDPKWMTDGVRYGEDIESAFRRVVLEM
jgi:hypothetical protein